MPTVLEITRPDDAAATEASSAKAEAEPKAKTASAAKSPNRAKLRPLLRLFLARFYTKSTLTKFYRIGLPQTVETRGR
jgi:hypothetical protein